MDSTKDGFNVRSKNGRDRLTALAGRSTRLSSVITFFAFKAILGIAIMLASTKMLTTEDFAIFTQLFLFNAYLTIVASGGVTNGIIRQVSAADSVKSEEQRITIAGLAIAASVGATTLVTIFVFSKQVSIVLTGSSLLSDQVRILGVLSLVSGVGQVVCAVLTGQGRLTRSLASQGVGLFFGSGLCLVLLSAQQPIAAVFGFAAGPILTTVVVLPEVLKSRGVKTNLNCILSEIRLQLRFAGAFLVTASVPPFVLFGLRQHYLGNYGIQSLGFWLLANRVSDLSTQLVGLYTTQIFLPMMSAPRGAVARLILIRNAALLTAAVSLLAFLVYIAASPLLTTAFLSAQFLPAIPFIQLYLLGDIGRTFVSIAMITALARGRPGLYASIEVATMLLMALITVVLVDRKVPLAPSIGYASAYWIAAIIGILCWILAYRAKASDSGNESATIAAAAPSTSK